MLNIVISFLTFVLILVSLFLVLVILMQRGSSSGGMGAAFGGGVAESAFGAETTNILTKATKWAAVAFFILSLVLYLLYIGNQDQGAGVEDALPEMVTAADVVESSGEAAETVASDVSTETQTVVETETATETETASEAPTGSEEATPNP